MQFFHTESVKARRSKYLLRQDREERLHLVILLEILLVHQKQSGLFLVYQDDKFYDEADARLKTSFTSSTYPLAISSCINIR